MTNFKPTLFGGIFAFLSTYKAKQKKVKEPSNNALRNNNGQTNNIREGRAHAQYGFGKSGVSVLRWHI